MVKYPFWVQKILHYTIQHEGGRHINFRQISISPGQTTAKVPLIATRLNSTQLDVELS